MQGHQDDTANFVALAASSMGELRETRLPWESTVEKRCTPMGINPQAEAAARS